MKLIISLEEQAFDTTDKITVFINLTHQLNETKRLQRSICERMVLMSKIYQVNLGGSNLVSHPIKGYIKNAMGFHFSVVSCCHKKALCNIPFIDHKVYYVNEQ